MPAPVTLLFDSELRFFTRQERLQLPLREKTGLKHLIEAAGVPHVEVGPVEVDGRAASLQDHVWGGETVRVHAAPRRRPPEPIRLAADLHLGRLTAYLRMLGFDVLYRPDAEDEWLAARAAEGRILLTRDRRLLMRKAVRQGYCPRSLDPEEQLREVLRRFDLLPLAQPFTRCLRCNARLQPVEKARIWHRLEPLTRLYYDVFRICPQCDQIYWPGSHQQRMQALIARLAADQEPPSPNAS